MMEKVNVGVDEFNYQLSLHTRIQTLRRHFPSFAQALQNLLSIVHLMVKVKCITNFKMKLKNVFVRTGFPSDSLVVDDQKRFATKIRARH